MLHPQQLRQSITAWEKSPTGPKLQDSLVLSFPDKCFIRCCSTSSEVLQSSSPKAGLSSYSLAVWHTITPNVVTFYCFKDKDCSRHLTLPLNYSFAGIIYSSALELSCFAEVPGFYCSQEKKKKHAIFFVLIDILWLLQAADCVAGITPQCVLLRVWIKVSFLLAGIEREIHSATWLSEAWPSSGEQWGDSGVSGGLRESLFRALVHIWCHPGGLLFPTVVILGHVRATSHLNYYQSNSNWKPFIWNCSLTWKCNMEQPELPTSYSIREILDIFYSLWL